MRTRDEHLQWAKSRALEYLPHDPAQAFTSFWSDVRKHEETKEIYENPFFAHSMMLAVTDPEFCKSFIEGWR